MKVARKSIPFARWPQTDCLAWEHALRDDGLFDKGPAAHWSAGTRDSVMRGPKRWIGFLMEHEPLALQEPVGARATKDRIERYVRVLQAEVSRCGVFNYIKHLYDALRVMAPGEDWSWLKRLARELGRGLRPRSSIASFVSVSELIELSERLMEEASGRKAHVEYRDGLIIAVLTHHALRRRNIARIRIGNNLQRTSDGYLLHFEGAEMKNGRPHTMELPEDLVGRVDFFLEHHRHRFAGASDHDSLWPSRKGGPMSEDAVYQAVRKRTRAGLGKAVHPHLFRSIAASTIATERPEQIDVAVGLLGHARMSTTELYVKARQITASRLHSGLIERLRSEARELGAGS